MLALGVGRWPIRESRSTRGGRGRVPRQRFPRPASRSSSHRVTSCFNQGVAGHRRRPPERPGQDQQAETSRSTRDTEAYLESIIAHSQGPGAGTSRIGRIPESGGGVAFSLPSLARSRQPKAYLTNRLDRELDTRLRVLGELGRMCRETTYDPVDDRPEITTRARPHVGQCDEKHGMIVLRRVGTVVEAPAPALTPDEDVPPGNARPFSRCGKDTPFSSSETRRALVLLLMWRVCFKNIMAPPTAGNSRDRLRSCCPPWPRSLHSAFMRAQIARLPRN